MQRVFVSYSSSDKDFATALANDLVDLGHEVWLDTWRVRVGDSIITQLGKGISEADYVLVILTPASVESSWVEQEWRAKYWEEIQSRHVRVIPLLLKECKVPDLLKTKRYADFRASYQIGLANLAIALAPPLNPAGIQYAHKAFTEIRVEEWLDLFAASKWLDLLVLGTRTWRNTYIHSLRTLLARGGRVRVIIPEFALPALAAIYAQRLDVDTAQIQRLSEETLKEFSKLASQNPDGKVEIYLYNGFINQALYAFEKATVVAFYSQRIERMQTPALILSDGGLRTYFQEEVNWLCSENARERGFVKVFDAK